MIKTSFLLDLVAPAFVRRYREKVGADERFRVQLAALGAEHLYDDIAEICRSLTTRDEDTRRRLLQLIACGRIRGLDELRALHETIPRPLWDGVGYNMPSIDAIQVVAANLRRRK